MPQYYIEDRSGDMQPVSREELAREFAPQGEVPKVDYSQSASDVSFQGAPKWYSQMKEQLLRRADAISREQRYPYGQLSPDAERDYRRKMAILDEKMANAPRGSVPFSITGSEDPQDLILLAPPQLKAIVDRPNFARRVFETATGIKNLPEEDIDFLRQRVVFEHPDIDQMASNFKANLEGERRNWTKQHDAFADPQRAANNVLNSAEHYNSIAQRNNLKIAERKVTLQRLYGRSDNNDPKIFELEEEIKRAKEQYEKSFNDFEKIEQLNPDNDFIKQFHHRLLYLNPGNSNEDEFESRIDKARSAFGILPINEKGVQDQLGPQKIASNQYEEMPSDLNMDTEESLFGRIAAPREQRDLETRTKRRVAPLNPLHDVAQRLMQRTMGSEKKGFDLADRDIEQSRKSYQISQAMKPYVDIAMAPSHELLSQAEKELNDTDRNLIRKIREETKENFLEEVLPKIQGSFATSGAFDSGARQSVLGKHAQKAQQHLDREIAKMMHASREKALERAGARSDRASNIAGLSAQAAQAQHGAQLKTAESQRHHEAAAKGEKRQDIQGASEFAKLRQQQLQNEIDAQRAAHDEQQGERERKAGWISNVMSGHPAPSTITSVSKTGAAPSAPNVANVLGGALGQLMNLTQSGHKRGGRVKNKFADGGPIARFQEMGKHIQPGLYDEEIKSLGSELKNYRVDPFKNWMRHVSAQMLANNTGDPLSNIGVGAAYADKAMQSHEDRMIDAKTKAANLYNAMNESRNNQHRVLADYEQKDKQHAEQARHHKAIESASMRNADLEREYKLAQLESLKSKYDAPSISVGDKTIRPSRKIGLTPQDNMLLKSIDKRRETNENKLHGYEQMTEFLEKQESEGKMPMTGVIAKYTPNLSDVSKEYERHLEKMVSGELPSGVLTNAKLAFAKGLKPTELDSPSKVKEFAKIGKEYYKDLVEKDQIIQEFSSYDIPPRVTMSAYDKWKQNGKRGEIVDYIADILEGKETNKSLKNSKVSEMSDEELMRIAS